MPYLLIFFTKLCKKIICCNLDDLCLIRNEEPIYDFPIRPGEYHQVKKLKTQQNEHYYSSVPDELDDLKAGRKLSSTSSKIKPMVPNKNPNNFSKITTTSTNQRRRPSKKLSLLLLVITA